MLGLNFISKENNSSLKENLLPNNGKLKKTPSILIHEIADFSFLSTFILFHFLVKNKVSKPKPFAIQFTAELLLI